MGFQNNDYERIINDYIGKQFHRDIFYKQAGNSIAVNVLSAIFSSIYDGVLNV
jgi:site-specific DNA-cytosine methylase